MKWLRRIGIALLVVLVALALFINFYFGKTVKLALEKGGPIALGVPVKLADADFRFLRGSITLKGFVLGNPEGFDSPHAISVDEITVELEPTSVFKDTIVIKRIYVNAPDINYELGLGTSNIGTIGDKAAGDRKEEPKEAGKSKKKVIIEDFLIENGKVKVAGAPLPLPAIHLTNIGKDEGGTSGPEVVKKVFGAIVGAVTGVVTGAGKLVGDGVGAVGDAAAGAGKAVGEAVKGIFGK